jgi:hypothetical protein
MKKTQTGFSVVEAIIILAVVALVGLVGWRVVVHKKAGSGQGTSNILKSNDTPENKAIRAGKALSGNQCKGTDKLTFTHLPMRPEDFSLYIPYGQLASGHVTPIDHAYFGPADYQSARDSYPVYAMADATITDIQPRTNSRGTEYRLVFAHSCTSLYYYDLVTSLAGKVKEAYDKHEFNLPVTAGDQIGAIGGQTLDFAYWDTDKPLTGFVNPASYDGEDWKIYTADPFPRFTQAIRTLLTARDARTAEPIAGKIDYDIDGKLIGNWFVKGTGGYSGNSQGHSSDYFKTHLSLTPDLYDPSHFTVSIGDFGGRPLQFAAKGNAPDPASVGTDSGLIKYILQKYGYLKTDGSSWDNMSITKNLKLQNQARIEGCLLVQMTEKRTIRAEAFPGKDCPDIAGFDSAAKTYER